MSQQILDHIKDECPFVGKMKVQMTPEKAAELVNLFGLRNCIDVLDDMDNYMKNGKTIDQCYTNVTRTMRNWLKIRGASNDPFSNL